MWNVTEAMISNNPKKENTMSAGDALIEALSDAIFQKIEGKITSVAEKVVGKEIDDQMDDLVKDRLEDVVQKTVETAMDEYENDDELHADNVHGLESFVENVFGGIELDADDIVGLDKEVESVVDDVLEEKMSKLVKTHIEIILGDNDFDQHLSNMVNSRIIYAMDNFLSSDLFQSRVSTLVERLVTEKLQNVTSNLLRNLLAVPVATPVKS
jgi:hypothetical protein